MVLIILYNTMPVEWLIKRLIKRTVTLMEEFNDVWFRVASTVFAVVVRRITREGHGRSYHGQHVESIHDLKSYSFVRKFADLMRGWWIISIRNVIIGESNKWYLIDLLWVQWSSKHIFQQLCSPSCQLHQFRQRIYFVSSIPAQNDCNVRSIGIEK